jgi:hypothetical protein
MSLTHIAVWMENRGLGKDVGEAKENTGIRMLSARSNTRFIAVCGMVYAINQKREEIWQHSFSIFLNFVDVKTFC